MFIQPSIDDLWSDSKKNQSEDERSKSGGTPATSVDALMSLAHGVSDKSSVGGVLVHMPHVRSHRDCIPSRSNRWKC